MLGSTPAPHDPHRTCGYKWTDGWMDGRIGDFASQISLESLSLCLICQQAQFKMSLDTIG